MALIADAILPSPAKGEKAAKVRRLRERYPELSQAAIARRVGCSEGNVSQVLKTYMKDIQSSDLDEFRADKANICEVVQHRLLSSLTGSKVDNMSGLQAITGFAILQDKVSLMRGQPTSIHVHALVDVLDALRRRDQE